MPVLDKVQSGLEPPLLLHDLDAVSNCEHPFGQGLRSQVCTLEGHTTRRLVRVLGGTDLVWGEPTENHLPEAKRASNQAVERTATNHNISSRCVESSPLWVFSLQRFERFLFDECHVAGERSRCDIQAPERIKAITFDASAWHHMGRGDGGHRRTRRACDVNRDNKTFHFHSSPESVLIPCKLIIYARPHVSGPVAYPVLPLPWLASASSNFCASLQAALPLLAYAGG